LALKIKPPFNRQRLIQNGAIVGSAYDIKALQRPINMHRGTKKFLSFHAYWPDVLLAKRDINYKFRVIVSGRKRYFFLWCITIVDNLAQTKKKK
jgi:hypothetical protein